MNYFTRGDRIPYDGIPDPESSSAPMTELTILDEELLQLTPGLRDRICRLPVSPWMLYRIQLLIIEAFHEGRNSAEAGGRQ